MPVQILARALDTQVDGRGWTGAKGYIIAVSPGGAPRGKKEGLPGFVCLEVTDMDYDQAAKVYHREWRRHLAFEVVSQNNAFDSYTVKLSVGEGMDSAGELGIKKSEVLGLIAEWNGANVIELTNSVLFDVTGYDVICSRGFWQKDVSHLSFGDEYDPDSAIHRASIPIAQVTQRQKKVNKFLRIRGAENILWNTQTDSVEFDLDRSELKRQFKEALDGLFTSADSAYVGRRQFKIKSGAVDQIATWMQANNNAGYVTDKATFMSILQDRTV